MNIADKIPKILLIGAGAIGGTMAAYLARDGYNVHIVATERVAPALREHGLRVIGLGGEFSVACPVFTAPEQADVDYDLCLIGSKAYDLPALARRALPQLKADAPIISLQNGLCLDALIDAVGEQRAVACIVSFAASHDQPGVYDYTGPGGFVIGRPQPLEDDQLLNWLAQALAPLGPMRISADIRAEQYSKLAINVGVASIGVLTGQLLGVEMRHKEARRLFLSLAREVILVAKAQGIDPPPFGGQLDYHRLLAGETWLDDTRRHIFMRVFGLKYSKLKSSSLQSLERGGKTEVDYLNGEVVRLGQQLGVPTPANQRLMELVREIESGLRTSTLDNLRDSALLAALWR